MTSRRWALAPVVLALAITLAGIGHPSSAPAADHQQARLTAAQAPAAIAMEGTPDGYGFWLVTSTGGVRTVGDAPMLGQVTTPLARPVVGLTATPDGGGYWLVATDGGVFSFGDARFFGSTGAIHLNQPIVGMAGTPDGGGYWLVAADGGVFSFGDARFFGSTGAIHLNQPIVGMARTADGGGYWLVASDGGVFAFGDARFFGSTGSIHLNRPIIGLAASPDGGGYRFTASDGGVFTFGDAGFFGSLGGAAPGASVIGISVSPDGAGYTLGLADGTVVGYGDAGTPAPPAGALPGWAYHGCGTQQTAMVNGLSVTSNVPYEMTPAGPICLDVYRKPDAVTRPGVVLIHGGAGWVFDTADGTRSQLANEADAIANAGFVAVNIDYRTMPYPFVSAWSDVQAAFAYVAAHQAAFGLDAGHLGVFGTSAGGILAGFAATQGVPGVRAVATWSAGFDFVYPSVDDTVRTILANLYDCIYCQAVPEFASTLHVGAGTAPLAIFNSDAEEVPLSQPQAMAAALQAAGVPHELTIYPGDRHAAQYSDDALQPTIDWFTQWVG